MIDGFRFSLTGHSDGSLGFGMSYILILNVVLFGILIFLINKGYRIKN
jgi:hypothetical protein